MLASSIRLSPRARNELVEKIMMMTPPTTLGECFLRAFEEKKLEELLEAFVLLLLHFIAKQCARPELNIDRLKSGKLKEVFYECILNEFK